jgi:surfactin family lipopeptide synthetase B
VNTVHRIIEQRASAGPESIAVIDGARAVTYRELNQTANALARRLVESGLTRTSLAVVRMPRGADLAIVLLAVLKAGACYTWVEPGASGDMNLPARVNILRERTAGEEQFLAIDIDAALIDARSRFGPNLPVLTRGSDVACVLCSAGAAPHVLVPHATIAALAPMRAARQQWDGGAGALDLWAGLMSGITLSVAPVAPVAAARPAIAAA